MTATITYTDTLTGPSELKQFVEAFCRGVPVEGFRGRLLSWAAAAVRSAGL